MYVGFVKTYSCGLVSLFHCFTSGLRLLQWVSDVDVRVPLAEQRCGDAVNEQLPSDEAHADQPQSVHSYLCWLHAVFVGSVLSLLAPCCLCWLLAVFVGSVLSLLAPCLSLGPFPLFLSFCLCFFLLVLLFCFVCIVYTNYSKVCVCVREGEL